MKPRIYDIKNLHLALSALIVIVVGFGYGVSPSRVLPIFFDFKVASVDLSNIFRAIMGLYIGLGVYWIFGILRPANWYSSTVVCSIFMGGLAVGRVVSIIADGVPSFVFAIGTVLELLFMVWGIFNVKTYV